MNIIDLIHKYTLDGFDIHIEVSGGHYIDHMDKNDPEDRPYYVNLYYGDSNGPHKPGTLLGIGYGFTLEEAFNNAVLDLKHPHER